MIIRGTIDEITKRYDKKGPYRNSAGFSGYKYVVIVKGEPFYYMSIPIGEHTKKGDDIIIIADTDHEVLAWRNLTKNVQSKFTLFKVLFDAYVVMTLALVALWWYAVRNEPEILNFVYFGGIPFCLVTIAYTCYSGSKKLAAHRILPEVGR